MQDTKNILVLRGEKWFVVIRLCIVESMAMNVDFCQCLAKYQGCSLSSL